MGVRSRLNRRRGDYDHHSGDSSNRHDDDDDNVKRSEPEETSVRSVVLLLLGTILLVFVWSSQCNRSLERLSPAATERTKSSAITTTKTWTTTPVVANVETRADPLPDEPPGPSNSGRSENDTKEPTEEPTEEPEDSDEDDTPPDVVTVFDKRCVLAWEAQPPYKGRHYSKREGFPKPSDKHQLGPCFARYSQRSMPEGGFTTNIDYFHHRDYDFPHSWRQDCYRFCLEHLAAVVASADDTETDTDTDLIESKAEVPDRYGKPTKPSTAAGSWFSDAALLIEASIMGMPRIAKLLATDPRFGPMDPLEFASTKLGLVSVGLNQKSKDAGHRRFGSDANDRTINVGINAVQQAIIGGHAEIVAILLDAADERSNNNNNYTAPKRGRNLRAPGKPNLDTVIDHAGRSVRDYITMKGSPIRPPDAEKWLGLDTTVSQTGRSVLHPNGTDLSPEEEEALDRANPFFKNPELGWSDASELPVTPKCDMDVIYGSMSRERFYRDYFLTGRPFAMRGVVPEDEVQNFHRDRWNQTERFNPRQKCNVGPTAYPSLSGQKQCSRKMTIAEIENGDRCEDFPEIPMVHARHPSENEFDELFPQYEGDPYVKTSGWRKLAHWFSHDLDDSPGWQVFFGGDGSGATLHWHNAAMNALYVGRKDWKLLPPHHRGFSGMTALAVSNAVDGALAVACTQHPGDLFYIPNYWGHLTVNHGFAIGAAALLPLDLQQEADARPRVFFVHVNKAGGTSMFNMLKDRCPDQFEIEHWGTNPKQRSFHATAHALIDRHGRDAWNNSYTFALVRHPLARVVSNYWFLVNQCKTKSRSACTERNVPVGLNATALSEDEKIASFHAYFHKLYEQYPPGSDDHYLFGSKGHGNEKFPTLNATQTSWMVDADGAFAVGHVYQLERLGTHLETLGRDLPCLLEDGDNDKTNPGHARRKLVAMAKKNVTPKYPNYKLFGRNERTNRILREVFSVDYENFGYDYDEEP